MNLSLLLLAAFLTLPATLSADDRYAWPLDLAPALTSTYAEYRSGRFHAGLDIKTWGKEGVPCIAVSDGYVWRVRTSPWGYGRALYIRLADGRTSVYAHLSGFSPAIEKIVAEEQDRREAYSVNLYLQADRLPVSRGEVIAYSGSTGSGYPHLHFEIRNGHYGETPVNPLINGFGVGDTIPPTPVSLAFIPLDVSARIGSGADVRTVPVTWDENAERYTTPRVSVWGRIGLAIKIFDRADASALTNRLAPYRIRLIAGGHELFRTTYDAFSYAQIRRVDLDRNFHLTRTGRKGYHNLYLQPGNDLRIYGDDPSGTALKVGTGILWFGTAPTSDVNLDEGPHDLTIVAEDANGNSSIVHVPVVVERGQRAHRIPNRVTSAEQTPSLALEPVHFARHVVLKVEASQPMAEPPRVGIRESDVQPPVVISDTHTAHIPIDLAWGASLTVDVTARLSGGAEASGSYSLRMTSVDGSGGEVVSEDGIARAIVPSSSQYDGFSAQVTPDLSVVDDRPGVEPIGLPYRFEPSSVPFKEMAQVHFRLPEGTESPEELGVYEWTDKGWSFVWNDQDRDRGTVWAGVWYFSTYALIRDSDAPIVENLQPAQGETVGLMPEISVTLRDSLSGILMEELISMTLDGKALIFEFDPEGDLAKGILRAPLDRGPHEVTVRVQDVCGNEASETHRFSVESE